MINNKVQHLKWKFFMKEQYYCFAFREIQDSIDCSNQKSFEMHACSRQSFTAMISFHTIRTEAKKVSDSSHSLVLCKITRKLHLFDVPARIWGVGMVTCRLD